MAHVGGSTANAICRDSVQQIIWASIRGSENVMMVTNIESGSTEDSATATEHLGDVETALVETLPNGTATATIMDPSDITAAADSSVGMLSYVMILNNLPRSFLELRLLIKSIQEPVASVMAAWEDVAPPPPTEISIAAPSLRRSLLQQDMPDNGTETGSEATEQPLTLLTKQTRKLQSNPTTSAVAPVFGIVSATAVALATCGNGVCEFGEAVGTWAYTESWHCPEDCPFELHACPQQVCTP